MSLKENFPKEKLSNLLFCGHLKAYFVPTFLFLTINKDHDILYKCYAVPV
jgi:hypothetical protein